MDKTERVFSVKDNRYVMAYRKSPNTMLILKNNYKRQVDRSTGATLRDKEGNEYVRRKDITEPGYFVYTMEEE